MEPASVYNMLLVIKPFVMYFVSKITQKQEALNNVTVFLGYRVISASLYLALFHFSYSLTNTQQKLTPSTDTV